MLHGWGQTGRAFSPLAGIIKDRLRVITADFPGHGSAKYLRGPYTLERFVKMTSDTMRESGAKDFHLLGWSMGGTVAAKYVLDAIEPKPRSLILLSATPAFVVHERNLGIGQHPAAVKKMERMIKSDPAAGLRDFIGRFFESGEIIDPARKEEIEDLLTGPDFPPDKDALLETLKDLAGTDFTSSPRPPGHPPVLIIYGSADKITPGGGQLRWRSVFDNITEIRLEGAGHAPHLTRTDETARAILDFAGSLE